MGLPLCTVIKRNEKLRRKQKNITHTKQIIRAWNFYFGEEKKICPTLECERGDTKKSRMINA